MRKSLGPRGRSRGRIGRSRLSESGSPPPRARSAFLNVPYDAHYEKPYLAFIAGLSGFGLVPRATVEITGSRRRLDRIVELIRKCRYSFHDLSRVELDRTSPHTPRFNMPFELGLAIALGRGSRATHQWFVFEAVPHRLSKSLSDLDGTDPYIHGGNPQGILRGLTNALSRRQNPPSFAQLTEIYGKLTTIAAELTKSGGSLFEARAFGELVVAARLIADELLRPS